MRVRADDDLARQRVALLDDHLVADARAALVVGADALLAAEVADALVVVRFLLVVRRHLVVQADEHAVGVPDAGCAHRPEVLDHVGGVIVGHGHVGHQLHDLPRAHAGLPTLLGEHLLGERRCHLVPYVALAASSRRPYSTRPPAPTISWISGGSGGDPPPPPPPAAGGGGAAAHHPAPAPPGHRG